MLYVLNMAEVRFNQEAGWNGKYPDNRGLQEWSACLPKFHICPAGCGGYPYEGVDRQSGEPGQTLRF